MPEESDSKAAEAAEKAYAAAAEILKTDEASSEAAAPVSAAPEPPAPVADTKPATPVKTAAAEPSPTPKAPVGKPGPKPAVAKKVAPKPAIKPAAKKVAKPKPVVPAVKPAPVATASAKKTIAKKAPITKPKSVPASPSTQEPTITQLKERIIMATAKKSPDLKQKVAATVADAKAKAKSLYGTAYSKGTEAYTKGSAVLTEVGEFSKGNVEAVVSSGKILSNGMKTLSREYVEDSKSAFETMTSDLKKLAAIKTPTELFQLQGELLRRNFDTAVAYGSKNSEKVVKLANEAFAPISNRVSLAVDKVSKAA